MSVLGFDKLRPYLQDFIRFYYSELDNPTGGLLHVALDDGNLTEMDIWHCQKAALDAGDTFGYFLATLLRHFDTRELEAMYENNWGLVDR